MKAYSLDIDTPIITDVEKLKNNVFGFYYEWTVVNDNGQLQYTAPQKITTGK